MDTKEVFYPMTGKIVLTMPDANGMIQCRIPQPLADGQPSHNDLDDMTGKIVLTMPDANGMIQCRIPQPLADGQPSHNDLDDNRLP